MFERFTRKSVAATGAALVAALGFGGAAIAQSGSPSQTPQKADTSAAQVRETPGQAAESTAPENSATDRDNIQDTTSADTTEAPGTVSAAESPGSESATEVPGADGPGGHADEPGNPNANHQFQGKE